MPLSLVDVLLTKIRLKMINFKEDLDRAKAWDTEDREECHRIYLEFCIKFRDYLNYEIEREYFCTNEAFITLNDLIKESKLMNSYITTCIRKTSVIHAYSFLLSHTIQD